MEIRAVPSPDGYQVTLLALEGEEPVGFVNIFLSPPGHHLGPQLAMVWSKSRKVSNTLRDAAALLISEMGYTVAYGINQSGKKNKVWKRAFTPKGWKATKAMTVHKFEKVADGHDPGG